MSLDVDYVIFDSANSIGFIIHKCSLLYIYTKLISHDCSLSASRNVTAETIRLAPLFSNVTLRVADHKTSHVLA